ncbi:MAG: hypothetical protein ACF8OB_15360 [Phycisphaeraceae bacterium JB051]
MLDGIIDYLKEFFAWMWDWVVAWFHAAFGVIAEYFDKFAEANGLEISSEQITNQLQGMADLLSTANSVLPLGIVFGIITGEWTVRLTIRAVRWVIGFIPTVEG